MLVLNPLVRFYDHEQMQLLYYRLHIIFGFWFYTEKLLLVGSNTTLNVGLPRNVACQYCLYCTAKCSGCAATGAAAITTRLQYSELQ
jgi:hypothetical protein